MKGIKNIVLICVGKMLLILTKVFFLSNNLILTRRNLPVNTQGTIVPK